MSTDLVIALVYKNDSTKAEYGKALSALQVGFHGVPASLNGELNVRLEELDPDGIIMEIEGDPRDFTLLERIVNQFQTTPVYAAQHDLTMTAMRQLMRAGVRDVLPIPPDSTDLRLEMETLEEKKKTDSEARQGKVVTVMSAKSGSGSTTLAVNLACELASQYPNSRVALLDMDIQFGDISLFLNIKSQASIMEAVHQAARLDPVMLKTMMVEHDSGIHVLTAPTEITRLDKVSASDMRKVVEMASQYFDLVVLDMPHFLSEWSEEILRISDNCLLVIQKSLSTLRDAKRIMDYLPRTGVETGKIQVINNRCQSKHGSVSVKQIEETLGLEHILSLANDYDASMSSQDHGQPLLQTAKRSRLRKDIAELAEDIAVALLGQEEKTRPLLERLVGKH